jgi:hypothetical protein
MAGIAAAGLANSAAPQQPHWASAKMSDLPVIPLQDIRQGGPVRLAVEGSERARALRDDCLTWLLPPVKLLLPAMDWITRSWLRRSCSPYVAEIEAIARALRFAGVWFLNGTYEWGCTAVARDEGGAPWLARTLDWPFPGLGRHLEIARMQGRAGEFFNVTWPGYAGSLTASAPGRFAAAINQAPLWRRTGKPWLRPYDIALNALQTWQITFCPADHLLRQVFEDCRDFAEAKHRLETAPIARPAIFTLVGCEPGERCVIERTESGHSSRVDETAAANDWLQATPPWEARVAAGLLLTCSYGDAAAHSRARRQAIIDWPKRFGHGDFEWATPPVLNPFTRCAIEMCPARAILRAAGLEVEPGSDLPRRVTAIRHLDAESTSACDDCQAPAPRHPAAQRVR